MKLRKASMVAIGVAAALPVGAAESLSPWPDRDLAKFVFEHLDLTTFRNSTGPRRSRGDRFFKDLAVYPNQVTDTEATSTNDEWRYSIRILETRDYTGDGMPEVLICFSDVAQNGGSYSTMNSYVLQYVDGRAIALALDDEYRAEKAGCKRAR